MGEGDSPLSAEKKNFNFFQKSRVPIDKGLSSIGPYFAMLVH